MRDVSQTPALGPNKPSEADAWKKMGNVPKDGSRILVVIRATEQGPAAVDVVRWTRPKNAAEDCWVSTESSRDCAIIYEDWELAFWMPLPSTVPPVRADALVDSLPAFPREGEQDGGSGI